MGFPVDQGQIQYVIGPPPMERVTERPPRWILLVVALGLVLLATTNAVAGSAPISGASGPDQFAPLPPAEALRNRQFAVEPLVSLSAFNRPVAVMRAPAGEPIPASLTVATGDEVLSLVLEREIFGGMTRRAFGIGDQRLWAVAGTLVFVSLDVVTLLDMSLQGEPEDLGSAVYLLPGSEAGHVWAVGSASRSVRDLDIANRQSGPAHDLSDIGVPLTSFPGGLVVVPRGGNSSRLGLWEPGRAVELVDPGPNLVFIGAAQHTLVFAGEGELARFDMRTRRTTRVDASVSAGRHVMASVSPDSSKVAVARPGSVTGFPSVDVIDTHTGTTVASIEKAFAGQLQWISPTELLYLAPVGDAYQITVYDMSAQSSTALVGLDSSAYWFAPGA